jgi:hypothetical protein
VLVEVLRRIGPDLQRTRIKSAAESLHDWKLGIDTPVSFAADKHQGLNQVYYTVAENERFVRLLDWKRWRK